MSAGTANGDSGVTDVGLEQGAFGGASDGQFLDKVDISSVAGAEDALGRASLADAVQGLALVRRTPLIIGLRGPANRVVAWIFFHIGDCATAVPTCTVNQRPGREHGRGHRPK